MASKKNVKTADDETVKDDFVTERGGVEIRLPSLAYLRPGIVRVIRKMNEVDAVFTILEASLTKEALAEIDNLDVDEFDTFLTEWREHSGVSLGES